MVLLLGKTVRRFLKKFKLELPGVLLRFRGLRICRGLGLMSGPRNFHIPWVRPKKKTKTKQKTNEKLELL